MYLAWYDASKKLTPAEKIANACLRYQEKFGTMPTEVLLHPADAGDPLLEWPQLTMKPQANIGKNCYWVGTPEDNE